ncbi:MAG: hypothetical protein ACRDYA_00675 [Egibacteraceae bacterium]
MHRDGEPMTWSQTLLPEPKDRALDELGKLAVGHRPPVGNETWPVAEPIDRLVQDVDHGPQTVRVAEHLCAQPRLSGDGETVGCDERTLHHSSGCGGRVEGFAHHPARILHATALYTQDASATLH